jgi:hypothetical protein
MSTRFLPIDCHPPDVLRGRRQLLADRPAKAEDVVFMLYEEVLDLGLPLGTPSVLLTHLRDQLARPRLA